MIQYRLHTGGYLRVNSSTYLPLLQNCIANRRISEGKLIQSYIINREFRFPTNTVLQNALINMYDKCGSLFDARRVFDHMTERDQYSWNTIIAACRKQGVFQEAWILFGQMQRAGVEPNQITYATILPVCAKMRNLEHGAEIHQKLISNGFWSDVVVANALLDMLTKCGNMKQACELFDKLLDRDVVSWNTIIAGYARNGFVENALDIFREMQLAGVNPNSATFATILPACVKAGALEQGLEIHRRIIEGQFLLDVMVANTLISLYAKCGVLQKARQLFHKLPQLQRDVVSWNAIISGYAQNGQLGIALETFKEMQYLNVESNSTTFASVLPACFKMGALEQGMEVHRKIIESGFYSNVVVANTMITMYAKCGSMEQAHKLFAGMPEPDAITWTATIGGYVQNGFVDKGIEMFQQMQLVGVKMNASIFASILPAYAKMQALNQGMKLHKKIIKGGFLSYVVVVTALIDMYVKCGRVQNAHKLFDKMCERNVVSWNSMIAGYTQNKLAGKSLKLFNQMQLEGVKPNSLTFVSILAACAKIGTLEQSREIHTKIIESGILSDVVIMTAMINAYAKCGNIQKAYELFDRMPQQNVVSWTAIIVGYAQNGLLGQALEIFKQMQLAGVNPDSSTLASILPVCTKLGALDQGIGIHQKLIESSFLSDVVVVNALIDMYAKCGSTHKARKLFDKMHNANLVSWSTMIAGYAMHGCGKDAIKLFELMKLSGTNPDHVSFICVFFACSHGGLVDEGCKYFNCMSSSHQIMPTVDHYICIVDLLSRAGYLEETLNFIIKMPIKPDVLVWMCLLGACKSHQNIVLGEFMAMLLFELDSKNAASHVLLSNTYAEAGRWAELQNVRGM